MLRICITSSATERLSKRTQKSEQANELRLDGIRKYENDTSPQIVPSRDEVLLRIPQTATQLVEANLVMHVERGQHGLHVQAQVRWGQL